jgi:hypothetical protein
MLGRVEGAQGSRDTEPGRCGSLVCFATRIWTGQTCKQQLPGEITLIRRQS